VKYLRLFEELWFEYEDNFLRIQRIKGGPNKGKVNFSFKYINKSTSLPTWSKYSPVAACVKLLDTKYEKDSKIRNIQISIPDVKQSTMDAVFRNFLKKLGYTDKKELIGADSHVRSLRKMFGEDVKNIGIKAHNIGDILDGLKEIESIIEPYLSSQKYNL
jgi:hypothetical protein